MADTLILEQGKPSAGTRELLFTADGPTVLSSLRACNVGRVTDYARIARVFGSEAEKDEQYLAFDVPIPPGQPYAITEGVTLDLGDSIYVQSRRGSTSFNVSGAQRA